MASLPPNACPQSTISGCQEAPRCLVTRAGLLPQTCSGHQLLGRLRSRLRLEIDIGQEKTSRSGPRIGAGEESRPVRLRCSAASPEGTEGRPEAPLSAPKSDLESGRSASSSGSSGEDASTLHPALPALLELKDSLHNLISAASRVTAAIHSLETRLSLQSATQPPPAAANAGFSNTATYTTAATDYISLSPHELALKIQQAFIQARIEGLGKPAEVAVDDFVDACIEASLRGMDLPELQLKLILADGSLPPLFGGALGTFSTSLGAEDTAESEQTQQDATAHELFGAEETRVRTLWVRLVYTTLLLVRALKSGEGYDEVMSPNASGPPDPMDGFVQQTVTQAIELGHDLDFLLAQQRSSPPSSVASPSIRMMRQSQILILSALKKGLARDDLA